MALFRKYADSIIESYLEIGTKALHHGQFQIAYTMCKAAMDEPISKEQKKKHMRTLLLGMGQAHEGLGQLYKAKLFYIRVLAFDQKSSMRELSLRAEVLARLAKITAQQGLFQQARDFAVQAIECNNQEGNEQTDIYMRELQQLCSILRIKGRATELACLSNANANTNFTEDFTP